MKKYVKPQLYYENFELTQRIAGDCGVIMNHTDLGNCTTGSFTQLDPSLDKLFETEGVCEDYAQGYCYTKSTNMVSIFWS